MEATNIEVQVHLYFQENIRCLIETEKRMRPIMAKMLESVSAVNIRDILCLFLEQSETRINILEAYSTESNELADEKRYRELTSIIKHTDQIIIDTEEGSSLRDAALIVATQRMTKFKIKAYENIVEMSKIASSNTVSQMLCEILDEEQNNRQKLLALADKSINNITSECR